jgi:cell division protein FtsB
LSGTRVGSSATFRSVLGIGAVALLVLLALGGLKGYRDLGQAQRRESELSSHLRQTRERILQLEDRIEDLESDPSTLEALAREELMMVRPGDIVIVLDETTPREAVAAPSPGSERDPPEATSPPPASP